MNRNFAIFGSSGAIDQALTKHIAEKHPGATVHAFSRANDAAFPDNVQHHMIDYLDEAALEKSSKLASTEKPFDQRIVATGILHQNDIKPEKSLRAVTAENLRYIFDANTTVPALIAKHFVPNLNREAKSQFGVLSARAGSIADNVMGGWYAYRASKAALNMIIKNIAIEISRNNKNAVIVSLHPGVVDSPLSEPFQKYMPDGKLFSPEYAATSLLELLDKLTPEQSGRFFAWDGEEIAP